MFIYYELQQNEIQAMATGTHGGFNENKSRKEFHTLATSQPSPPHILVEC